MNMKHMSPLRMTPDATAGGQDTTTPEPTPAPTPSAADAGWTPYTPDPTKSLQENLVLKEEYDKKAPEGHDPNQPLAPKTATPASEEQKPAPETSPSQDLLTLDKLTVPEGYELDSEVGTEFVTLINQHRADPAKLANELINLQVKAQAKASEMASRGWDETQAAWKKAAEADPEIGGSKYSGIVTSAKQISDRFGGQKFIEALELTGMGNHPEWLRFASKIGPLLQEASPVVPSAPSPPVNRPSPTNFYPEQQ